MKVLMLCKCCKKQKDYRSFKDREQPCRTCKRKFRLCTGCNKYFELTSYKTCPSCREKSSIYKKQKNEWIISYRAKLKAQKELDLQVAQRLRERYPETYERLASRSNY